MSKDSNLVIIVIPSLKDRELASALEKTSMSYPAINVANSFLDLAFDPHYFPKKNHPELTQLKLISLIYYTHGSALAILDRPLISDPIIAGENGPQITSIFDVFGGYGLAPIKRPKNSSPKVCEDDTLTHDLLLTALEQLGSYHEKQLYNMTHHPKGAWFTVQHHKKPRVGSLAIKDEDIKKYFQSISSKEGASEFLSWYSGK